MNLSDYGRILGCLQLSGMQMFAGRGCYALFLIINKRKQCLSVE